MAEVKASVWKEGGLGALLSGFSRLTGAALFLFPPRGKAIRLASGRTQRNGKHAGGLVKLARQARETGCPVYGAFSSRQSLFASPVKMGGPVPWVIAGRRPGPCDPVQIRSLAEIIANLTPSLLRQNNEIESLSSEVASCYEELSLLFDLGESIHRAIGLKERCQLLLSATANVVGARKAYLALLNSQAGRDKGSNGLEVIASLGYETSLRSEQVKREARLSLTKGQPEIRGRARLLVPLRVEERTIGVLVLGDKQNRKAFNSPDLKLLTTVASQVAVVVENARLYADLEALFLGVVESLVSAIEARDPSTKGHSDRVKKYALEMGQELGLPEAELRRLELTSLLHDIGKIGYSDAIFTNPTSTLSREHWQVVERHTQVSEMILTPLAAFGDIVPSIRWHHERYDGKGYPDGLKGEQIPLPARIVSVADSYDAMTSERSYRNTFTTEQALDELAKNSGGQFDPRVVDVFVRLQRKASPTKVL